MPLNSDISTALQLLEHIQHTIDCSDDVKLQAQTSEDLNLLIAVLENPILRGIVTVQSTVSTRNIVRYSQNIVRYSLCTTNIST
ncbi:unnamed protein product [Timema podura]|uniref:L27 domain-containing protein n=1 Tax=Timema podura TaxID=61482 RepID=A0ABN7NRG5_TIMPD|nr:unnamed protein product [Timema podura]